MGRRRRHRPGPRPRPAGRREARRRHRRRRHRDPADRPARRRRLHRLRAAAARRSTAWPTCEPWTPREATSAKEVPGRLLIVGGGVRRLRDGHRLAGARLAGHPARSAATGCCRGWSPPPARRSPTRCARPGVDVRLGAGVTAARREGAEVVLDRSATARLRGDEVLVATGRGARHRRHRPGHRRPGRRASTSTSTTRCRCAACRGCTASATSTAARCSPTWASTRPGRPARRSSRGPAASRCRLADWSPHVATADHAATPQVVFTDPQVGLGRAHRRARRRSRACRTGWSTYPIGAWPGASLFADGYTGTAIAVVDTEREVLLGRDLHRPGRRRAAARRRRSRSSARCRSPGSGTPSRPTRRSARSGSACSRPTGADRPVPHGLVAHPYRDCWPRSPRSRPWTPAHDVELVAGARRTSPGWACTGVPRSARGAGRHRRRVIALGGDGTLLGAMRLVSAPSGARAGGQLRPARLPRGGGGPGAGRGADRHGRGAGDDRVARLPGGQAARAGSGSPSTTPCSPGCRGRGWCGACCRWAAGAYGRFRCDASSWPRPMGSTAYNYAAGGPVVSPGAEGSWSRPSAPMSGSAARSCWRRPSRCRLSMTGGRPAMEIDGVSVRAVKVGDVIEVSYPPGRRPAGADPRGRGPPPAAG